MSFWQENYGFVKEVYDYRMKKYQEWMENLEGIVKKVLKPNVQYTYKEFKIIQDTLGTLCRDLEKEGMKEWLDLMLEKVSMRVSDEGGSTRDKEFKKVEKGRLTALINRHDKLMPATLETQEKVEIYALCYSFGDDVQKTAKTLEEMLHLSTKEIHPHCLKMVEDQKEKAERIVFTLDNLTDTYDEFIKRGQKLVRTPNCAPFMGPLVEKLETLFKEANAKAKERVEMLTTQKEFYAYREEMQKVIKPLEEMLRRTTKRFRPYNSKMVKEQKERHERAILVLETMTESCEEFIKRGQRLIKTPNCAPFMIPLVEKLETLWKDANEEANENVKSMTTAVRDWEKYDDMRAHIIEPCDKLEIELKDYKKIFDPEMGAAKLKQRKQMWEEYKTRANDMFRNIQKCYTTIAMLAGEEKREFLDREVNEVDEKRNIIARCEAKLKELEEFNEKLVKAVKKTREIRDWAKGTEQRLRNLYSTQNKTQEDRVKENICIQEESKKRLTEIKALDMEYHRLLPADDISRSEVARSTMFEFEEMKKYVFKVSQEIEKEAGTISTFFTRVQDLCGAWSDVQLISNSLMNAYISIPQSTNPGVASLDGLFKKLRDVLDSQSNLLESMEREEYLRAEAIKASNVAASKGLTNKKPAPLKKKKFP